jgi:hypothetical protein
MGVRLRPAEEFTDRVFWPNNRISTSFFVILERPYRRKNYFGPLYNFVSHEILTPTTRSVRVYPLFLAL